MPMPPVALRAKMLVTSQRRFRALGCRKPPKRASEAKTHSRV